MIERSSGGNLQKKVRMSSEQRNPPSYVILSSIVCVLIPPLGFVSLYYSIKCKRSTTELSAWNNSKKALFWFTVSFIIFTLIGCAVFMYLVGVGWSTIGEQTTKRPIRPFSFKFSTLSVYE